MKKLMLVIPLLMLCAALETPEDYQWAPNKAYVATLSAEKGYSKVMANVPEDMCTPKPSLPL